MSSKGVWLNLGVLVIGALAGAAASTALLQPKIAALTLDKSQGETELARVTEARDAALERVGRLEQRLEGMDSETRRLQDTIGDMRLPSSPPALGGLAEDPQEAPEPESSDAAPQDPEEARREQERAERREQWNTMREERRASIEDFMQEQIANATDPATKERLQAMMEYGDYLRETRDAMENAKTDEERDALRRDMEEGWGNLMQLRNEQKEQMLRDFAQAQGITKPKEVNRFVNSYQDLEDNPLFGTFGGFGGPGGFSGRGFGGSGGGRRGGGRGGR